jgi:hypothetical protein
MKMRILVLALVFALGLLPVLADSVPEDGVTPVRAELMSSMYAHKLHQGEAVFARVLVDWRSTDCILNTGSILEAHVISVVPHTKVAKGSQLDLAFTRAQCGERKLREFPFLLAAVVAVPEHGDQGIFSDPLPFNPLGGGFSAGNAYREAASVSWEVTAEIAQATPLSRMKMGDVSGIKGLKLSVGTGPDNSSVLSSRDHDVAVESHTLLLLIPARGTIPQLPDNSSAAQPVSSAVTDAATVATAEPSVEDMDICEPPQCDVELPTGTVRSLGSAAATISIGQLGYIPRPQKPMRSFDFDEALAYLSPKELLVAFNPHILAPRHALGRSGWTIRVIRAALVDTTTHRVTRTVDWELPDDRQYLWPLGEDRVMVHVGSELRIYGEGLKVQNRISLDGPLAFVRSTPDGSFLALGVIRERHTPELHAQLVESLDGVEPEEDVDIQVLNRNFEIIAKSTSRSTLVAPTLLNEGQAQLLAQPNMRYRISMLPWKSQSRTFARFTSSCRPELSSIASDFIFLVSCDQKTEEYEYRVLGLDGKLAMKGFATAYQFGYAAGSSANHKAFLVKTVDTTLPVSEGAQFSAKDFSSEELKVYRASDGKRLLDVSVGSPSSSRDGYALSPDGSQLAVLTLANLSIYSVPVQ